MQMVFRQKEHKSPFGLTPKPLETSISPNNLLVSFFFNTGKNCLYSFPLVVEKNCQHQFPWNKLIFHSKNYPTLLLCKLCTRIVPVNSLLNFHTNQLNKTILIDRCEDESLRILESLQNVIWHWISRQHISRIAANEGLWIIVVINCSLKCLSPAKTSNKLKTMKREQVSS